MRLVNVVLVSALFGLTLGLLNVSRPDVARAGTPGTTTVAALDCNQALCQRVTWLRTPLMRRSASTE